MDGGPKLDVDKCLSCGLCAVTCPTGALASDSPSGPDLVEQLRGVAAGRDWASFACRRTVEGTPSDEKRCVNVQCIGAIDPAVLLSAVSFGLRHLYLVCSACADCPVTQGKAIARKNADTVNRLAETLGVSPTVSLVEVLPPECSVPLETAPREAMSRREFFALLRRQTTKAGAVTADAVVGNGSERDRSHVKTQPDATIPVQRQLLLAALRRLADGRAAPNTALPGTGLWATYAVTADCVGCQMCAYFCPTGALTRSDQGGVSFQVSRCTGCGVCRDVCFKQAITLSDDVSLTDVLDDRVVHVGMARPPQAGGTPERLTEQQLARRVMDALPSKKR